MALVIKSIHGSNGHYMETYMPPCLSYTKISQVSTEVNKPDFMKVLLSIFKDTTTKAR